MKLKHPFVSLLIAPMVVLTGACQQSAGTQPDAPPPVYAGDVLLYCWQPGGASGKYSICTIGADGAENRKLPLATVIGDNYPCSSPDGTKVVYTTYYSNRTWSIRTGNLDGSNVLRLTSQDGVWDYKPAWSPDGRRIAFLREYPSQGNRQEIWIMNADGGAARSLGVSGDCPRWSPDGSQLVYHSVRAGNAELYTCASDGTKERQLTHSPEHEGEPDWSPDGRRIVFTRCTGEWDSIPSIPTYEIGVMNADGSAARLLTTNTAYDGGARWSPDGLSLAFVSNRAPAGKWEIFVMAADGTNVRRITTTSGDDTCINPTWKSRTSGSTLARLASTGESFANN